ncbi:MAG: urate hydroxylase PuuD [Beijerinckiaceae bacterium]|nr:urate hydroxylase PuuD [Beijerinckiaceae bacterium]MCZ8298958.1 urate hydroxylase PuuD [Beijerinckiaceae bacterium]
MVDYVIMEWGSAALRWLHVIAAMAWIGSSFFFMHLDAGMRPHPEIPAGKGGAAWQVHGGGFYEMKKYLVAPASLPAELTWHKWQSYMTWLSGFFLLGWIYYAQSSLYLIDPAVRVLSPAAAAGIGIGSLLAGWIVYDLLCKSPLGRNEPLLAVLGFGFVVAMSAFYAQVFSGRGALIHTGALMATVMSGNVFRIIIPNQKKVIAALLAGEAPDPALGKQAKQRSVHNNYLTLPVVFLMISNHYPLAHTGAVLPLLVALITFAGAVIRHFFNGWHADHAKAPWWCWIAALLAFGAAMALSWQAAPGRQTWLGAERQVAAASPALTEQAIQIVQGRCSMCHAGQPVWDGISAPPKGVKLAEEADILREAKAIGLHAVLTHAMPPNNITEITAEERAALALWLTRR